MREIEGDGETVKPGRNGNHRPAGQSCSGRQGSEPVAPPDAWPGETGKAGDQRSDQEQTQQTAEKNEHET
jgi:hypothetical protein